VQEDYEGEFTSHGYGQPEMWLPEFGRPGLPAGEEFAQLAAEAQAEQDAQTAHPGGADVRQHGGRDGGQRLGHSRGAGHDAVRAARRRTRDLDRSTVNATAGVVRLTVAAKSGKTQSDRRGPRGWSGARRRASSRAGRLPGANTRSKPNCSA